MSTQSRTTAVADVYAADTAQDRADGGADATCYVYRLQADPDPDVLARVAGVCNLANVAPRRVALARAADQQLSIEIELEGISGATADSIRRKLLQLTCVTDVDLR